MYLQALEIIGFKSFAVKTVLNFHRGVTAIVGPNGCGKSNVLDAMRWVLGEQSAKALRGGEMADVIFGGTDSRSALGMAEVSLTFAECEKDLGVEWNEVRLTRRVYRDGKSEYFLNKAPCRLRDIHQLFMDTGVGRSAYSIMEQGKIDQILSSRPDDRRAIFEEAAGITKYKAQKKEALRKLEYTEANLLRVQDIIKEVKRQIGSLQRQAAKARRFQSCMQDLRTFDTHLSYRNYKAFSTELTSLREELDRGDVARGVYETEIAGQEIELTAQRARIEELDIEITGYRDAMQNLRNRIFASESRISTNAERREEALVMIDRHRSDIAQAEEKLRTQEEQIQHTDFLLSEMVETLRGHEQSLAEQNEKVSAARVERSGGEMEVQRLGSEIARFDAQLGSLRGEISSAASRREAGETRQRLLQAEAESASASSFELSARLDDIQSRADRAVATTHAAQAAQAEAQSAWQTAQNERQNAETEWNSVAREAAGIESRLEVLRQLQEQGEGFDEGTQALLRGLDNPDFFKPAIAGALADYIQVDPQYIPAVEAALGGALQAVVFKDSGVAESAIMTLAGKKLGKAAVVPVEWLSFREIAPNIEFLPEGGICRAADYIGGEGEGCRLARELLSGVVVVDTLETAFRLKSLNPALGFVTLGGEFISREGIVRGGQAGGNAGGGSALMRKAQISGLENDLNTIVSRMEFCDAARTSAFERLEESQELVRSSREAVQAAQVDSASLENERKLVERQLSDVQARCGSFARETAQIEESLRGSLLQMESLEARIAEVVSGLEAAREHRIDSEQRVMALRDREASTIEALNEIRVRVATERQQRENLDRQRGPMSVRLAELAELLDTRRADIANSERRLDAFELENATLRDSVSLWQEELGTQEAQIGEVIVRRNEVHASADAIETALRGSRQQLVRLQEQKGRMEVRIAQVEMRMENLRNHVSQRYQTDLEAFEPDSYALQCAIRDRNKKKQETPAEGMGEVPSESVEPVTEQLPVIDVEVPSEEPQEAIQEEEGGGIPWGRIEEIVAELTERVESMGPVNVEAIQEYDELEQRHIFLEKQNADLVNSKAELLDVISRINRTTKELFAETFEKIRVNFQEMFTELFGGGRANLMLVDDSDPLESGIEIIAKPPGKQLQSISLLSGGERTMAAVALLFAIYMVKPSPFCVLDEMDAPLDDSNISRFVKILDRFVDQSQFVVITHSKRTISRADMVFGVTMEEHGVSKIVSMKFSGKAVPEEQNKSVAEALGKDGNLHSERELAEATPA